MAVRAAAPHSPWVKVVRTADSGLRSVRTCGLRSWSRLRSVLCRGSFLLRSSGCFACVVTCALHSRLCLLQQLAPLLATSSRPLSTPFVVTALAAFSFRSRRDAPHRANRCSSKAIPTAPTRSQSADPDRLRLSILIHTNSRSTAQLLLLHPLLFHAAISSVFQRWAA